MTAWLGGALAAILGWCLGLALRQVASWLLARRGGASSGRPLPAVYVQAATAATLAVLWLHYGPGLALLWAAGIALVLLLIATIDYQARLVLNELLLAGCVPALLRAGANQLPGLQAAAGGAILGLGLFLLAALAGRGALGMGDVKLAGLIGLALGYPLILQGLFLGVLAGGLVAAFLLLTRRVARKAMIPYAPFLVAGGILGLLR